MQYKGKQITIRDKRGIEVFPDDVIAMGFRDGSSGSIRIGTILEYLEYDQEHGKPNCYLKVQWEKLDVYVPDKATRIYVTTESNILDRQRGTDYWRMHEFVKVLLPNG